MGNINGVKLGRDKFDWHVGGNSAIVPEILVPGGNWKPYKLEHELQFNSVSLYDTQFCVTYSAIKVIGYLLNYYISKSKISQDNLNWLKEKGYIKNGLFNASERFNASLGGTDENGAYQFKIANSIYNYGLIPQDLFPLADNFKDNINHKFITQAMYDLGKEFKKRFTVNYQWVDSVKDQLPYSPVQVIVKFANYNKPEDILSPKGEPNHAVCDIFSTETYNEVQDTYWQEFKRYNPSFTFSYLSYKLTINNNNNMDIAEWLKDNDRKWVRNSNTGAFGRCLQNKLFTFQTTDRAALALLDDKVREFGITITNEEWLQLPNTNF